MPAHPHLLHTLTPTSAAGGVFTARFSSTSNHVLHGGASRILHLVDARSGAALQTLSGHAHPILACGISRSSNRLVSAGPDRTLFLWDASSGTLVARPGRRDGHLARVNAVAFAARNDELVLSASYDRSLRIWDARNPHARPIQVISDASDSVTAVLPDGDAILTASVDGCVRSYDIRKGMYNVDALGAPIGSLALTQDRLCILAACLDGSMRLLQRSTGDLLELYRGHANQHFQLGCAVSGDDAFLFCGDEGGGFCMYDVSQGKSPVWRGGGDNKEQVVAAMDLCPSTGLLVVGRHDGNVSLWKTGSG
ncbi:unnamed protein product [Chondrus crispus]|uniref:Uncharacterized protein n=1 Tax=Chondrus crispus TaxID=2769 RepID=R7QNT7_CHOCR|nr:unnamed protein product [Chondrus crispus]CDF40162.1 unnamed protein product [Chondrus crispus]|eukprot:XP_005710456.1 unnamed protein product [Chondrus crispus]